MKIFMALMGLGIGGVETHVLELSKELVRLGHNVTVASCGGVYQDEMENAGVKHVWAPLHMRNPIRMIQSFFILLFLLRKQRPDIIHAHARIPAFLCGIIAKMLGIPFATSAHYTFTTNYGYKYISNWGAKTLAVSDDIKVYLQNNYKLKQEDIIVSVNGVDVNKFSANADGADVVKELGLVENAPRMIYVSRLNEVVCGPAFILLEIYKKLSELINGIELIIVGDGNARERLQQEADKVNEALGRRAIVLTGGRVDVYRYINAADVCIGVSRAVLEGMAAAKPVIMSGLQGYMGIFRESVLDAAILNNFTCRGFPLTDKQHLFEDVLKLFKISEQERRQLGEYGRSVVEKYYSVKKMGEDNLKLYRETIHDYGYDVMISGYYGFHNSGDDALLYAMVASMKQRKEDVRILVLSKTPKETAEQYGVASINRYNVFKIVNAMRRTKLYINGGGSLIQDITSTKSLLYYLSGIALAGHMGVKTMLYANGIGPVKRGINRLRVKLVLNRADYITLRDKESMEELNALGITKPNIRLGADPAFTLNVKDKSVAMRLLNDVGFKEGDRAVCISLRKWRGAPANLSDAVAKAADYIYDKYGLIPLLLPMQYPFDAHISRAIMSKMKAPALFLDARLDTETTLGIISMCDLVLAVRLHTLIYASALNIPAIGIAYDPKVSGFLEFSGQPYYISPSEVGENKFIEMIDSCIENHIKIKDSLKKVTSEMKERAEESADIAISLME